MYLIKDDFISVGLVAKHCDLGKLDLAIEESKNFDMIPLFCFDFVNDVLNNWGILEANPDYQKYRNLIDGDVYINSDKSYNNLGFKKVWVYYAYARYLLINQFNDTANGTVIKDNEWSSPTPLKEIKDYSNDYRDMGAEAFKNVQSFLCKNKEIYPKFDTCNCQLSCGCFGGCSCGNTKKITGFKFSTVSK